MRSEVKVETKRLPFTARLAIQRNQAMQHPLLQALAFRSADGATLQCSAREVTVTPTDAILLYLAHYAVARRTGSSRPGDLLMRNRDTAAWSDSLFAYAAQVPGAGRTLPQLRQGSASRGGSQPLLYRTPESLCKGVPYMTILLKCLQRFFREQQVTGIDGRILLQALIADWFHQNDPTGYPARVPGSDERLGMQDAAVTSTVVASGGGGRRVGGERRDSVSSRSVHFADDIGGAGSGPTTPTTTTTNSTGSTMRFGMGGASAGSSAGTTHQSYARPVTDQLVAIRLLCLFLFNDAKLRRGIRQAGSADGNAMQPWTGLTTPGGSSLLQGDDPWMGMAGYRMGALPLTPIVREIHGPMFDFCRIHLWQSDARDASPSSMFGILVDTWLTYLTPWREYARKNEAFRQPDRDAIHRLPPASASRQRREDGASTQTLLGSCTADWAADAAALSADFTRQANGAPRLPYAEWEPWVVLHHGHFTHLLHLFLAQIGYQDFSERKDHGGLFALERVLDMLEDPIVATLWTCADVAEELAHEHERIDHASRFGGYPSLSPASSPTQRLNGAAMDAKQTARPQRFRRPLRSSERHQFTRWLRLHAEIVGPVAIQDSLRKCQDAARRVTRRLFAALALAQETPSLQRLDTLGHSSSFLAWLRDATMGFLETRLPSHLRSMAHYWTDTVPSRRYAGPDPLRLQFVALRLMDVFQIHDEVDTFDAREPVEVSQGASQLRFSLRARSHPHSARQQLRHRGHKEDEEGSAALGRWVGDRTHLPLGQWEADPLRRLTQRICCAWESSLARARGIQPCDPDKVAADMVDIASQETDEDRWWTVRDRVSLPFARGDDRSTSPADYEERIRFATATQILAENGKLLPMLRELTGAMVPNRLRWLADVRIFVLCVVLYWWMAAASWGHGPTGLILVGLYLLARFALPPLPRVFRRDRLT